MLVILLHPASGIGHIEQGRPWSKKHLEDYVMKKSEAELFGLRSLLWREPLMRDQVKVNAGLPYPQSHHPSPAKPLSRPRLSTRSADLLFKPVATNLLSPLL